MRLYNAWEWHESEGCVGVVEEKDEVEKVD